MIIDFRRCTRHPFASLHPASVLQTVSMTIVGVLLICASGCGTDNEQEGSADSSGPAGTADPGPDTAAGQADTPDDAAAVQALEALGVNLERDADGFVVLAGFRDSAVSDDDLRHVRGLRRLARLQLNDADISDAGLAHLSHLQSLRD
ncbi:MAG: hypothetical protein VB858_19130, partial [Planctomycetaceae bacterium]